MIRGLSPIPRGGGKPEGKEGDCITTLGAVCLIEGVWVRTPLFGAFLFNRQIGTGLPRYRYALPVIPPSLIGLWGCYSEVQAAEYIFSERV